MKPPHGQKCLRFSSPLTLSLSSLSFIQIIPAHLCIPERSQFNLRALGRPVARLATPTSSLSATAPPDTLAYARVLHSLPPHGRALPFSTTNSVLFPLTFPPVGQAHSPPVSARLMVGFCIAYSSVPFPFTLCQLSSITLCCLLWVLSSLGV